MSETSLWSFDGQILDIFGVQGCKIGSRAYFGYNRLLVEHRHDSVKLPIVMNINDAKALNGGKDNVARISLSHIEALQLYFENVLTISALQSAAVEPDKQLITIKLPFANILREVLIRPQVFRRAIGLYDQHGSLICYV